VLRRMEGRTEFHPQVITSPLGYKIHPWGTTSPLGYNFATRGQSLPHRSEVKNGPQSLCDSGIGVLRGYLEPYECKPSQDLPYVNVCVFVTIVDN
jgi:hypothetical protein